VIGDREEVLRRLEQDALEALRFNWGEAYEFTVKDGTWTATRRDGLRGPLEAASPDDLRVAMWGDYSTRAVQRLTHEPEPAENTAYTADGPYVGRPVTDFRLARAYPMTAHCAVRDCEQMIRREEPGKPWEHTGRKPGEE
jgi:hypothetical protein